MKSKLYLLIFCFFITKIDSQKLSINQTLEYIENIENIYTNSTSYVSGNMGITERNKLDFDIDEGILTKTSYWVNKGETIEKIQSVNVNDLSKEVEYSDKWMKLKCMNENCFKVTNFKYDNSTNTYSNDYYIDYSNKLNIYIIQEYNAKKALTAFKYLFSLFNELNLERDKDDPFAQNVTNNTVSFKNSNSASIQLHEQNGTFQIPVKIGGIIEKFVLDSGASDTTISSKIEAELIRNGIISKTNYLSNALYRIADGSVISQRRFILPILHVGNFTVKNITISVGDENSPLLLGKNFLDRFKNWSIDNSTKTIKLQAK